MAKKQQTSTTDNTKDKPKEKKGVSKYFKPISNSQEDAIDLNSDSDSNEGVVKTNKKKRKRKRLVLSEDEEDEDFQLDGKVEKLTPKVTRSKSKRVKGNRKVKDFDGKGELKDEGENVDDEHVEKNEIESECDDENDSTYKPEGESGSESEADIFVEESHQNGKGNKKDVSPKQDILSGDESVGKSSSIDRNSPTKSETKDENSKHVLLKSTASVSKKLPQGKRKSNASMKSKQSNLMASFSKQQSLVNDDKALANTDKNNTTTKTDNISGSESDGDIFIEESHKSEMGKFNNVSSKEKLVNGEGSRGKSPEIELISSTSKTEPKKEKSKPFVLKQAASTSKKRPLGGGKNSAPKKSKQASLLSSFAKQQSLLDAEKNKGRTCPVCLKEFPPSAWNSEINEHIDNCLIE